ncbi:MAG: prephenate dehydrogenase/arogenate dehydrogenase family protein [Lachnospiraceae bacterium]|nr:prephenate dehydrogenase/arogenate dehydrogenase family protein [Lachnospiraceae bacterium]
MNKIKERSHFGFIGFGLIGGSIAHALRILYPESEILAYNYYGTKPHSKLELAKKEGTLSGICTSLSDFSGCEVIFLCAPVLTNVSYLQKLAPFLGSDCILTDVGSVKGNIHKAVAELGLSRQFVGGHPMTGSEKTGYANSAASFLNDAYYILTPTPESAPEYVEWMKRFIHSAGSICMVLDDVSHDRITAGISHVPHIISAALVNAVADRDNNGNYAKLAAGGFRDITRISSSSPEMWQNICLTNPDGILNFLEDYIGRLEQVRDNIKNGDGEALTEFFSDAKSYRDTI